jgi:glucan phosphoethanolaminetransferase (alkaline phosphatase superfamily)
LHTLFLKNTNDMRPEHTGSLPFRNAYIIIALILPLAIFAFWKTYVSILGNLPEKITLVYHLHAVVMTAWILMLIAQAWLIKAGHFTVHRAIGRASYVVVPLIIVLGLGTIHAMFNGTEASEMSGIGRLNVLGFGQLVCFLIVWGLAIRYRRQTPLHARFMISTIFAIGPAIIFRILLLWIPGIETVNAALIGNWIILTLPLLFLILLDWKKGITRSPFWVITLLVALMHIGYWTFATSDWWLAFCMWFRGM